MVLVLVPDKTARHSLEWLYWTSLNTLEFEDHKMASSPPASPPLNCGATLHDGLEVPKPADAIIFPADVENAEDRDFKHINVIALFKKKNYMAQTGVGVRSNIARPTASVLHTSWTVFGRHALPSSKMVRLHPPYLHHIISACLSDLTQTAQSMSEAKLCSFSSWAI